METLKRSIELLVAHEASGHEYTSVYQINKEILGDLFAGEGKVDTETRMAYVFTETLSRWADARQSLVRANEDEIRNAQRMIDGVKDNSSYSWHMDSRRVNEYVAECAKHEDTLNTLRYIIDIERETLVAVFRMATKATFAEKAGK
jgi:hypothetical protein